MERTEVRLRAGDWVEVKTEEEITETLDAKGTVDGLPFMPEMIRYCGARFRVERLVEKTCVEFDGGMFQIREFVNNNVVLLEVPRCTGLNHDGCQRACILFWKTAWLRRVKGPATPPTSSTSRGMLEAKMMTMTGIGRYFCQSTQLADATRPLPRSRIILKCISDVRSGSRGILEMVHLVAAPLWRKATAWFPRKILVGTLKRTPVDSLGLEQGEFVKIRPAAEIRQTLDGRGCNRGLKFAYGPWRASQGIYEVQNRVNRMILESTGEMKQMENTVILKNSICTCENVLGGCPRQDPVYWREVWLERVESPRSFQQQRDHFGTPKQDLSVTRK